MYIKPLLASALLGSAAALGGCADNYAVEGAAVGAAAGAGIAAATGEDVGAGAAIGAGVGAAAGYFVDKDSDCDGWRDGRWDDDCRGRDGYPD